MALLIELEGVRAERGQRRVEGPPFGLDQFGLDSYVDPDSFTLRRAKGDSHLRAPPFGYAEHQKSRLEQRSAREPIQRGWRLKAVARS